MPSDCHSSQKNLAESDLAMMVQCRAGMVSDEQLKQIRLLRAVLAGKNPYAEGQPTRLGSTMSNLSLLRGSLRPQIS